MNACTLRQLTACLLAVGGTILNAKPDPAEGVTAVCSRVSKDYVRTKRPDGSFQPEEYVLVKGGRLDGPVRDPSFDNSTFIDVARAVAGPLAAQNYLPANKQDSERLIIMVYWGTTAVPSNTGFININTEMTPQNADQARLEGNPDLLHLPKNITLTTDARNAMLLGYDSGVDLGQRFGRNSVINMAISSFRQSDELLTELEENRYFVILLAFDFQAYRAEKKHILLWETRFSIQEARNFFDKALPVMAQYASPYFGRDSHGLVRTRVPEGKVIIGESRALDVVEAPKK